MELNRLDEATTLYTEALTSQPENRTALIGLAECEKRNSNFAASLENYQRALKLNPKDTKVQFEVSELLFKRGSFAEAEAALEVLLSYSQDHFLAHIRMGFCARYRNDRAAAAAYFARASKIDPTHIGVRLEMAGDLLELGRLDEAEAGFRAVLAVAPEEASAHIGMGHCARRRGDLSASLKCFLAAAACDPRNIWAKPEAAADLLGLNRLDEAQVLYNEILISQPENVNALIGLVHCARRKGDSIAARANLNRAIAIDANNIPVLLELANEQREAGEWEDAKATLRTVLDRDPKNLYALIILGLVHRAMGEHKNALTFFTRAHEFHLENAQLLVEMAIEERHLGRQEVCDRLLTEALDLSPFCVDAIIQCAEQAMMAHNAPYALQVYQSALERDPLQLRLILGAARTLTTLGKFEDAIGLLDSAKIKLGMQPEIESTRISLLRQIGDWHHAMTLLRQARVIWPWHFGLWIEHAYHELSVGSDQEVRACLDACPASSIHGIAKRKQLEGLFAERCCAFDDALAFYKQAAALNVNDSGIYADLTRLNLKMLQVDDAREHLGKFCMLNIAATKLQGKSTNISQTIFGQWLDEYALNAEEVGRVRGVLGLSPREQIGPLLSLIRENPDNTAAAIGLIYALRLSGLLESGGGLARGGIPERIIQFWDSPDITPDIQRLMRSWRDKNPGYEYVLFNDDTARRFLQENFTADVLAAYVRVREPAQKSDIFRLAYLAKEGGIYVDANDFCLAPLGGLIAPNALLALYQEDHGTVGNNFIAVVAQHPVILEALAQAVLAVNRGDSDMPWLSTGPALLTRSIANHIANSKLSYAAVVGKMVVLNRQEFSQKVAIHCLVAYKETNRHWSNSTFAARKGG
jgi:tetratricopeptide (TPR) repeat protein